MRKLAKFELRQRKSQRGLTLIEVVIATGVLVVGLLGLLTALTGAMLQRQIAESNTIAINHGRNYLEQLLAQDETGDGVAYGMIEFRDDVVAGLINPDPRTIALSNEQYQVQFFDPADLVTPLLLADMVNRSRPILVQVTVTWNQGVRPMQATLSAIANPARV